MTTERQQRIGKGQAIGKPLGQDRRLYQMACQAMTQQDPTRAVELLQQALAIRPNEPVYLSALGEVLLELHRHQDALAVLQEALRADPRRAEIYFYMGVAAQNLSEMPRAEDFFRQAVQRDPDFFDAWFNLAGVCQQLGRLAEAQKILEQIIQRRPAWSAAWLNLGGILDQAGDSQRALQCWRRALSLEPDNMQALYNCGTYYQAHDSLDQAMAYFQTVVQHDPGMAKAQMNLGLCHALQGRLEDALACYQRAVDSKSDYARAWFNMAGTLLRLGRLDEVTACYQKVVELEPDNDVAHFNLAVALRKQERISQAMTACRRALQITPNFAEAGTYLLQLAQHACDWNLIDGLMPEIDRLTDQQIRQGIRPAESPMLSLRCHADPQRNLAVAHAWSRAIGHKLGQTHALPIFKHVPRAPDQVMRIAYISSDFKDHAVAHQIRGLLQAHDRRRFKIFGYACNADDGSYYRGQLAAACDHFIELTGMDDLEAARRIHADGIDILVDLMGYTQGHRMEIAALKPAPVQVGYLGFLGSSGAPHMDYFICDRVVTPPAHTLHYSEKLVYLPHCYQANDDKMPIAARKYARTDFGLPKKGVVFCSFNQPYKIDRQTFESWLNILNAIPHSVLWLLGQNSAAKSNLRDLAANRGVDPNRLIFSGALRIDRHLARLTLADLALDTMTYNGGATTSNALWAGVPVIALMGSHFVSRMSASALEAVGLPELVAQSPEQYCRLAIQLATNPDRLEDLRQKLSQFRLQKPLFNTGQFCRHLEKAFQHMLSRFNQGLTPQPISIQSEAMPTPDKKDCAHGS